MEKCGNPRGGWPRVFFSLEVSCVRNRTDEGHVWLSGKIVLEALVLTATVVLSLTAYTYWASKNGYDFNFLGPILFVSLIVLVVFGLIQVRSSHRLVMHSNEAVV